MKSVSLTAYPRSLVKRTRVKKLRASGRVPAVIYGQQTQPQSLEVIAKDLKNMIHRSASENILVDLDITGDARPNRLVLVQEVQHHVLSGQVLHVDFHEVAENETVTVLVPVEAVGEPAGVKTGGDANQPPLAIEQTAAARTRRNRGAAEQARFAFV